MIYFSLPQEAVSPSSSEQYGNPVPASSLSADDITQHGVPAGVYPHQLGSYPPQASSYPEQPPAYPLHVPPNQTYFVTNVPNGIGNSQETIPIMPMWAAITLCIINFLMPGLGEFESKSELNLLFYPYYSPIYKEFTEAKNLFSNCSTIFPMAAWLEDRKRSLRCLLVEVP